MSDAAGSNPVAADRSSLQLPDGRSIDLWQAGPPNGEPLLFHHGTPGAGLPFELHVRALAERGLRYVSYTRAGYGGSSRREGRTVGDDAEDARAALDHLGIERAWVMGWSGGGPHALACAARLADRVRGTALIAGVAPFDAEGLEWTAGMGAENVADVEATLAGPEALRAAIEPAFEVFRAMQPESVAAGLGDLVDDVDRGSLTPPLASWLAALAREALRVGYWGWYDEDIAFVRPWGFGLERIPGPVHLWQGAHDRMVPFAHGEWLAAHVANARPHLFAEHGHLTLLVDAFPRIVDELLGAGV